MTQSFHVEGVNRSGAVATTPTTGTSSGSSGSSKSSGCAFGGTGSGSDAAGALLPLVFLAAALGLRRRIALLLRSMPRAALYAVLGGLAALGSGCAAGIILPVAIALASGGGGSPRTIFPDVVVSGVSAPDEALVRTVSSTAHPAFNDQFVFFQGDEGTILATVVNSGDDAITSFNLSFYLSPGKTLTEDAFRVRTEKLTETLKAGESIRVRSVQPTGTDLKPIVVNNTAVVTQPPIQPGRYFLIAKVNDPNPQGEKNTAADGDGSKNNVFYTGIVVELRTEPVPAPAPDALDLAVTDLRAPTQVVAGTSVFASFDVTNFRAPVAATITAAYTVFLS
ncbi:MAG: hypothetical protein ACRELB_26845, partial [Polyangiaceae bacterium]